jgi:hypothetical protein
LWRGGIGGILVGKNQKQGQDIVVKTVTWNFEGINFRAEQCRHRLALADSLSTKGLAPPPLKPPSVKSLSEARIPAAASWTTLTTLRAIQNKVVFFIS